jgi:hypothetical protein
VGGAVHDGEDGGVALGRGGNMSVNFGSLAGEAFFCPTVDVLGYAMPDETSCDEVTGGSDPGVVEGMQALENGFPKGKWTSVWKVLVEISPRCRE